MSWWGVLKGPFTQSWCGMCIGAMKYYSLWMAPPMHLLSAFALQCNMVAVCCAAITLHAWFLVYYGTLDSPFKCVDCPNVTHINAQCNASQQTWLVWMGLQALKCRSKLVDRCFVLHIHQWRTCRNVHIKLYTAVDVLWPKCIFSEYI